MPLLISFLGCGVDDEGRRPAAPEPAGPNEPEPDDRTAPIDEAERIPPAPLENRVTETVIISRADLLGDDESEPRTIVDPIEEEDPEKTGLIEIEIPDDRSASRRPPPTSRSSRAARPNRCPTKTMSRGRSISSMP
jgi:hypothetical protein